MKIKVMAIVPYEGLKDMIYDVKNQYKQIDLEVKEGDLYKGVEVAQEAERNGYHVILSRGGTSALIQQYVTIPVVEIQVTGYDLMRSVTLVKDYKKDVAVVGFSNITNGAASIVELLELNISVHTMKNENDIYKEIQNMQKMGTKKIILGDVVTVKYAKKIGLNGVLITSGEESIKDSLNIIINLFKFYESNFIEKSLMKEALNNENELIIIVDEDGEIFLTNNKSTNKFKPGYKLKDSWKDLWLISQNLFNEEVNVKSHILKKDNCFWHIKSYIKHIENKKYLLLYIASSNKYKNIKGIEIVSTEITRVNTNPFNKIVGKSNEVQKVIEQSKKFSIQENPILIIGEEGTGKSTFSYMIHQYSERSKDIFITVDCAVLDLKNHEQEEQFYELVDIALSGTIYLKNIDALTNDLQITILELLKTNELKHEKCRFIASTKPKVFSYIEDGTFNDEIINKLSTFYLRIPTLNERTEDINSLAKLFIASFNLKYGKQIAGLKEEVLNELRHVSWNEVGNITALKNTIEELVLLSDGPFIQKEVANEVINELKSVNYDKHLPSVLHGTLKEIEKKIIKLIMEDENNNQTVVAERLGVNRTTLWRKLKGK